MPDLVALDLPAGPDFLTEIHRAWDRGDAIIAVDQRLPPDAKATLVRHVAASVVVDPSGATKLAGSPTEEGDALVVATSGTTGLAKTVVLTHTAVRASAAITSSALDVDRLHDRWLCCLPVAHIGGLSVVTRSIVTRTPLTMLEHFDAQRVEAAARDGATMVSLVVATLSRIDTSLFRTILLGGSAIPTKRPSNTVATYGMTETGSGVVYDGFALEGVQLRVVDGEIHVHSPTLFRAYRDGSDPKDGDGWYATGDAGSLDASGRLSVRGRIAEVIVTGGEKVWPVEVEHALAATGRFREIAVVGRPNSEWGEVVTAIVVLDVDQTLPGLTQLRDELTETLPRYALPRAIEILPRLPRTSSGKVRRADL